jgi:DNA-binding CsgD family transcriptional regulator
MQVNLILAFCIHFFNLIFLLSGAIRYKKLILLIENKDIKNLIKWGFAVFMFMIATQMFMVIVKFHDPLKADIKHAFIYPLPIILLDIVAICFSLKYYRSRHVGESVSDIFIKKYYITEREKDVIELLVKGKSNKEIAKSLDISVNTVKTNIYNIFQKTGAKNRFGLITMARLSYN